MFLKKEPRKLPRLALAVIAVSSVYAAGFYRGVELTAEASAVKVAEVRKQAYADGLASQDWKKKVTTDQKLMNKLAYEWWFGLTHKDRKIDLKDKPTRW